MFKTPSKAFQQKINKFDVVKILVIFLILSLGIYQRYRLLDESGGDLPVIRRAVTDILDKKNPYEITVGTFRKDKPYVGTGSGLDHGYAYMPTLLYIYTPLYLIHQHFHIPLQRIWKSVTILAELAVSAYFIKKLYNNDFDILVATLIVWLFNPYIMARNSYTYTDPIGIFFMLIALDKLGKSDIKAGVYFALSVSFKAFPLILLPLFLYKARKKLKFIASGFMTAFIIGIPFMNSMRDFSMFFKGSFLVHSDREVQGRPFIGSVVYLLKLKVYTSLSTKVLIYIATFSGWIYTIISYLRKKEINIYHVSLTCFTLFFVFTPVFTRTYILWLIPIYMLSIYQRFKSKKVYFYIFLSIFYIFFYVYLRAWDQGFTLTNGLLTI